MTDNRVYFVQRAAEEETRSLLATDPKAQQAHQKLQRAYLEKALVGDRPEPPHDEIG